MLRGVSESALGTMHGYRYLSFLLDHSSCIMFIYKMEETD